VPTSREAADGFTDNVTVAGVIAIGSTAEVSQLAVLEAETERGSGVASSVLVSWSVCEGVGVLLPTGTLKIMAPPLEVITGLSETSRFTEAVAEELPDKTVTVAL
jgi:hypothetical protein